MKKYESTAPQPVPQPPYSDRQFLHGWVAGLLLPVAQSIAAGSVMSIFVAALIYAFGGESYLRALVITFAFTFVVSYFFFMKRWIKLTDLMELMFNVDLDNNQVIGPPRSIRVQYDTLKPNGHIEQSEMFDFTGFASEAQLVEFATGVIVQRKGMGETTWSGPDKSWSIDGYRDFRGELVRRRLAEAVPTSTGANNLGFDLTEKGRFVFQQMLKELGLPYEPPTPSPTDDGFGPKYGATGRTHARASRAKKKES